MKRVKINKKRVTYNIVGLFFVILLVSSTVWFSSQNFSSNVITPQDEAATVGIHIDKPVAVSPQPKNTLAILFYYEGYDSQTEALHYVEVLKTALSETEPFKSMGGYLYFNTFTSGSGACHTQKGIKKWLVCDPKLVQSLENKGYKNFKVIVLSPEEFTSSSAYAPGENSMVTISSFRGNLSDKKLYQWMGILFTQELGRSLGLQYEYIDTKPSNFQKELAEQEKLFPTQKIFQNIPNCATNITEAEMKWGKGTFYKGCGEDDSYIYPVKNTLMSNLPLLGTYGRVSEEYLRNMLQCYYGHIAFPECATFMKKYPELKS